MSKDKEDQLTEKEVVVNQNENDPSSQEGEDTSAEHMHNLDAERSDNSDSLTILQEKCDSLNDKYLRLYSEFENFRRRTAKEKLELSATVTSELLRTFLPIMDDFDRAIAGNEHDNDLDSIKEGFKLIHQKFLHLLEQKGVKPMNAMEQVFDTEFHEAITNIPAPDPSLVGKVVDVAEKGYYYKDNVLRYAKVVVGQ